MRPSVIWTKLMEYAREADAKSDAVMALALREAASIVWACTDHTLERLEDAREELRRVETELARGL